jgi:hypothetical protein
MKRKKKNSAPTELTDASACVILPWNLVKRMKRKKKNSAPEVFYGDMLRIFDWKT